MSHTIEQPTEKPSLPPLRIHHFLLWTVAVALLMSFLQASNLGAFASVNAVYHTWSGLTAIPEVIALVTLGLLLYWWTKGLRGFGEVGQWLLIPTSLALVIRFAEEVIQLFLFDASFVWIYQLFQMGGTVVNVCVYYLLARSIATSASWKRFAWWGMGLSSLGILFSAAIFFERILSQLLLSGWWARMELISLAFCLLYLIWFGLLVTAAWRDFRSEVHLHWSHWCGVITVGITTVSFVCMSLYFILNHWLGSTLLAG